MIIPVEKSAGQNSAYRHRNMEGAFGNEGALRFLSSYRWTQAGFFSQERQNFFHQCVGGDAMFLSQDWDVAVLDELIRPADAHHRRVDHLRVQMFHHRAAETVVQNVILDRANHIHAAREKFERAGVHGFDPTGIDQRDGNSFLLQFTRRFLGYFKHVAKPKSPRRGRAAQPPPCQSREAWVPV